MPLTYGVEVFAPAMTDYLGAWPDVSLELDLSNRVVDLVEEGFDAAVRIGRLADSSFVARPLKPYRMRACASPVYLAKPVRRARLPISRSTSAWVFCIGAAKVYGVSMAIPSTKTRCAPAAFARTTARR